MFNNYLIVYLILQMYKIILQKKKFRFFFFCFLSVILGLFAKKDETVSKIKTASSSYALNNILFFILFLFVFAYLLI